MDDSAAVASILWVGPEEDGGPSAPPFLAELAVRPYSCRPGDVPEYLQLVSRAAGGPPAVVVIDARVDHPLRVARHVFGLSPLSHLLFIVPSEKLPEFRSTLSLAPMIGTYWNLVRPDPEEMLPALQVALTAYHQRRHLRTSLDTIALRLGSERPPRDSEEYRKLVISDRYLAAILEHAQDAIVSIDRSGRIVTWNRGAERLFGIPATEAPTLKLEALAVPSRRAELREWFDAAARGHPVPQRELECPTRPEGTFVAEATFAPVRDEAGDVIAVSLTIRDITDRKRTEEELRRIKADLENRVIQRTEELRAANAELEAFNYSASHDLRAPLRGIDGFSQALLDDYGPSLDEQARMYIERIRAGAQRMGSIIDALLMLSRISQAQLQRGTIDLTELALDIVAELRERERQREVEVRVEPNMTAYGDRQLLRIVLANLLDNAWKFTREKRPALIEVGLMQVDDGSAFYVKDNGAGFDMAYGEKLFAPFQRLHHPQRFEGSGIGLGTVQRIVARHGGRVWARGEPEKGATFFVQLPDASEAQELTQARLGV